MKTIAVLTDFSPVSEHAALYALHLAKKIKADVVLYHLYRSPVPRKLVLASGFPDDEDQDVRPGIHERFEVFSGRLKSLLIDRSFPDSVLPEITYDQHNQEIVDVMTSVVNSNDIMLIVTAPPAGQDMATYMLSEHCRQIMQWATVPVIVVPDATAIRNPEKIAITANLDEQDIDYINALINLVEQFPVEIMVSHLTQNHFLESKFTPSENNLVACIRKKIAYGRIYYKRIIVGAQEKGWKWLNDNKKCDLLVIRGQSQSALKEFFNLGRTPATTHHITIPVIVLPDAG